MKAFGVLLTLAVATSSIACYNDNDTYLTELRDNLDITNAIVGRFTLYPPEYYWRRIDLQREILRKDPNNLDAYDNISVAYDRIGEGAKALKWIHEKRKHLSKAPKEHLYSTEANEGTFLIVRWIRGHKPGDVADAIAAEKHIVKAMEINPNAHFGREFAQLYCIRAMIECGKQKEWMPTFTQTLIKIADRDHIDREKLRYGICGMMVLGAAWNVPVFIQAIMNLVPNQRQVVMLCNRKIDYLFAEDPSKLAQMREMFGFKEDYEDNPEHMQNVTVVQELLKNGTEFQEHKQDWILRQITGGHHPDYDGEEEFWKGFTDVPPISKSRLVSPLSSRVKTQATNWLIFSGGICIVVPAIFAVGGIAVYLGRKRRG